MENASKALIIAGGILIALIIVGALVIMFSNLSSYQNSSDVSKKAAQVAEFNNQYSPYEKDNLTLMELKTIYNKIESNNAKNPEEEIKHNIKQIYPKIINDFKTLEELHKQKAVFKCIKIGYDKTGKVNEMMFEVVNIPK